MGTDTLTRALRTAALALTLSMPWLLMHLRPGADLAMDLVGLAFLARSGLTRDWRWINRPWVLAALAWWAWLIFCTLWDRDLPGQDHKALLQAVLTIRFLLFAAALENWVLVPALARRRFLLSLGVATLYLAAQVLLQFTTGHNLYGAPRWGDGSLTGPFDRPRAGPTFVRMLFPALLPPASWLLSRPGLAARLGGGLLVLAAVAVMVLIGQRMPVLLTALGLLVAALLVRRLRVPAVVALVAGGALIGGSAVVSPPTFYRLVTKFSTQMEGFADSAYGQIAQRAVVIAAQHPWTGRGYDGFDTGCPQPRYFQSFHAGDGGGAEMCVNHPHNWYLAAADDGGLPGLALFCVLVGLWLAQLGRGLGGDPLRIGLFVAAVLQAWPIASTSPIQSMPIGGWFFLLLGFGLAASCQQALDRGGEGAEHVRQVAKRTERDDEDALHQASSLLRDDIQGVMDPRPTVTIVLPHRERFGPLHAGAVGMVVQRQAAAPSRYPVRVMGHGFEGPIFPGIAFHPVRSAAWVPSTPTHRYAVGIAIELARLPPGPIEVHNKPDVALLLARLFPRRPVTLLLHNDPRTMRGANSPAARTRLLRRLAAVVTVSDEVRRCLLEGVVQGAPAPEVIHNTLDRTAVPAGLPAHQREKLILFAGRVVHEKAPDAFIAACAAALPRLPGWRAEVIGADGFVAGAPDSSFISALRPAAAAAGVAMLGLHTHTDVLAAMARAAIVVVPSRWAEPFGLAALEAMACGAAVACSNRGGLAEVTGDAAVPIDPDNPAAMANALVSLAQDPARRAELSARGIARVDACFSTAAAIARLDALRDRVWRAG